MTASRPAPMSIPFSRSRRLPSRTPAPRRPGPPPRPGAAPALLALGGLGVGVADAAPEVRRADGEYLAIVIEAEASDSADERWVLTEPGTAQTPETTPDPDGNHSDGAVGQAYIELLPDHRVTHDDVEFPEGTPPYLWGSGRSAPQASYTVDFPEAGRYHVHARAFSTGTEDNGVHVGLDGEWPESGERMQWCSAGRGWTWSSKQRGPTHDTSCGYDHTIHLDVPAAGPAEVVFGAREDGFELDRFMLIKDLSDGERVCSASGADDISCRNGTIEAIDGFVDVGVELEASQEGRADDDGRVELTATVENHDGRDVATFVMLDVEPGEGWPLEAFSVGEDEDIDCRQNGNAVSCTIRELAPRASENIVLTLAGEPGDAPELRAAVRANESDDDPVNDTFPPGVAPGAPSLDASLGLDAATVLVGETVVASAAVSNAGEGTAADVVATLSVPAALEVGELDAACAGAGPVVCELGALEAGESVELQVSLVALDPAEVVELALEADAEDVDPVEASADLVVVAPETGDEGGGDEGGGDGGVDGADEGDPGTVDGGNSGGGDAGGSDGSAGRETGADAPASTDGGTTAQASSRRSGGGGAPGAGLLLALAGTGLARRRRGTRV